MIYNSLVLDFQHSSLLAIQARIRHLLTQRYLKLCGDPSVGSVLIILIFAFLLTRSSRSLLFLLSGLCGELFLFSLQLSDVTFTPLRMSKLLTAKKKNEKYLCTFKEIKSDIIL